ncbi:patatin-like phospholipase family protein [Mesorhizobium huakuii]|uniref:Patatin-like phospholipase family protein n=1 Tax=Mesorhizobium huakuii TaxID=28104 RepID=A0ABZ0VQK1_9HYPH|nr:patatin-like phospholipase family protein [Mesorhizobium huakuii]WQB99739.1 patatin-like phospholipase family protein [Mesorhizobium huakuii]
MAGERAPFIALALSGGGARAIAFHLGCLRALCDRGILEKVKVVSTVSGGSVIGAAWAYSDSTFEVFETRVESVLRRGLQWEIAREVFCSWQGAKIVATLLVSGLTSFIIAVAVFVLCRGRRWLGLPTARIEGVLIVLSRHLPIWGSLTTAFEAALARTLFGKRRMDEVARPGLAMIVNACDLRTGTAFRFGSERSGGWRYGDIVGAVPTVAKAVAASAAFPILLPPLIEKFEFEHKGVRRTDTVSLTDGGVFDNLGVAVLEPGRAHEYAFSHPVTHIISLNAGGGQLHGEDRHYWWLGRVARSFGAVHRKAQDAVYRRLHKYVEAGELDAFGMIYLGQQDNRLPWIPPDLVRREQVKDYPTDFAPMSAKDLNLLAARGEQLTHLIVDRYLAEIAA